MKLDLTKDSYVSTNGWTPPEYSLFNQDRDTDYKKRLGISIGLSIFLNLLIIWVLLASNFSNLSWKEPIQKRRAQKEVPKLVLIPTPAKPRAKTFLETDPSQASPTKPKDADFYSEHNTVATQTKPSPEKPGDLPKMDGKNTKTMATESVSLSKKPSPPLPVQNPTPQTPERSSAAAAAAHPSSTPPLSSGDLALLKPPPAEAPTPEAVSKPEKQVSNTSPVVAPSSPSSREVPASKSKLEGGVQKTGSAHAFNSAESPFATYDKKIIGKIGAYWQYQVVDKFYGEKVGEVEVSFKLLANGRVSELRVTRNSANAVLAGWCVQAIEKSSPFDPFPASMRTIAGDYREGTITFAY